MLRFIQLLLATITFSLLSSAGFAAAPSALYNKSVMASWAESWDMTDVEGVSRHRVVHHNMGIYVSSAGRLFMQSSRVSHNRGREVNAVARSRSPEGSMKTSNAAGVKGREVQMTGRSIVVVVKFDSGARRMEIKFDEGFRSCSVSVVYGKEDNAPATVTRGMDGRLYMTKTDVSSKNCSVRDGNAFAE
jgi:hypothetical protein